MDATAGQAAALLLGAVGATVLLGCEAAPSGATSTMASLQGAAGLPWFDTYAELRLLIGGATSSSANVAVGRGKDTGGVFVWTADTTHADDGGMTIVPTQAPRTGCWKRIVNGAVSVAWFGAKGDGVSDDSAAIRAALQSAGSPATIFFPAGVYIVSEDGVNNAWCLNLTSSNVTLLGAGRDASTIKMAALQSKWTRIISANLISGITIRGLTIDGNKAAQTLAACGTDCGQQHGVLLVACTDITIEDVCIRDTMGDNLYLFSMCTRVTVSRSSFSGSQRAGIHAQTFSELIVRNCQFSDAASFAHIYQELDSEGQQGYRAIVTGCAFSASSPSFGALGILFAGKSTASVTTELVICGNVFRNLPTAIAMNAYSNGYAISGNVIEGCAGGICSHNYSTDYGFVGNSCVAVVGNVLRECGSGLAGPPIALTNSTNSVIAGNSTSGSLTANGILLAHCRQVAISANAVQVGTLDPATQTTKGISVLRTQDSSITRNVVSIPAGDGSVGIVLWDDSTYDSSRLFCAANQIAGTRGTAVSLVIYAGGQIALGQNAVSPSPFLAPLVGANDVQAGFPIMERSSSGGRKQSYGAAAPLSGSWAVGDQVTNTAPSAGGYQGWVCVAAGTPGTWKGFDLIST